MSGSKCSTVTWVAPPPSDRNVLDNRGRRSVVGTGLENPRTGWCLWASWWSRPAGSYKPGSKSPASVAVEVDNPCLRPDLEARSRTARAEFLVGTFSIKSASISELVRQLVIIDARDVQRHAHSWSCCRPPDPWPRRPSDNGPAQGIDLLIRFGARTALLQHLGGKSTVTVSSNHSPARRDIVVIRPYIFTVAFRRLPSAWNCRSLRSIWMVMLVSTDFGDREVIRAHLHRQQVVLDGRIDRRFQILVLDRPAVFAVWRTVRGG